MILIIIKNLVLVACLYVSYKLAKHFFDDDQKVLRIVAAFVLAVITFGIANGIMQWLIPDVNVDKQLQNEAVFVALKKKYPDDYESLVNEVTSDIQSNQLDKSAVLPIAKAQLTPIALKLAPEVSDQARSELAESYMAAIESINNQGGALCYALMVHPQTIDDEQWQTINNIFINNDMQSAILTVIQDNKVGKAVASQKDMDNMEAKIFKQLYSKHDQDIQILLNPIKATTLAKKQTYCQLTIDLYGMMNDPNNKVKKAVLRRSMQNLSGTTSDLTHPNSITINRSKVASPAATPEPQMAAPVY